jgi:hypothetical protein
VRLGRNGRIEDHLRQAVAVAQVDKDQRAVVTPAVNPAGQQCLLAGVLGPQLAARVGAIHWNLLEYYCAAYPADQRAP